MSIWTETQSRYDSQTLVELTRPRTPSATTVDDAKGNLAATAVEAYFTLYGQITYDATDTIHVEVATEGVIAVLFKWGGTASTVARVEFDAWVERLRAVAKVGPRAHVPPTTSSRQTPSDEVSPGQTLRPAFDDEHFSSQRLNPPGAGTRPGIVP